MTDRFDGAPVIDSVRQVGFDTDMYMDACRETIFFVSAGGISSRKATTEAIREGIRYLQNEADVMRDYLLNDCNPNTHEWTCPPGDAELKKIADDLAHKWAPIPDSVTVHGDLERDILEAMQKAMTGIRKEKGDMERHIAGLELELEEARHVLEQVEKSSFTAPVIRKVVSQRLKAMEFSKKVGYE